VGSDRRGSRRRSGERLVATDPSLIERNQRDCHQQPSTHQELRGNYQPWIDDQSAGLTVGLEGPLVGKNECLVAFAADR
jgi:hypothetical protein